jgi:hypothetical protein
MSTTQDLTRQFERQVSLAIELIEDAPASYPEIAEQIAQFAPTILTTALGVPVKPSRLHELADAKRERDNAEDGAQIRFWERRYDELLSALIAPALAAAS